METGRKFLSIIGWAVTIILQGTMALLMVFVISLFFPSLDITSRAGWMLSLVAIWLGFTLGIFMGGWLRARRHVPEKQLYLARLGMTALAVVIPLAILLGIGMRYDPSNGSGFTEFVLNTWEPRLSQLSLWLGIIGFYVPEWFASKPLVQD